MKPGRAVSAGVVPFAAAFFWVFLVSKTMQDERAAEPATTVSACVHAWLDRRERTSGFKSVARRTANFQKPASSPFGLWEGPPTALRDAHALATSVRGVLLPSTIRANLCGNP